MTNYTGQDRVLSDEHAGQLSALPHVPHGVRIATNGRALEDAFSQASIETPGVPAGSFLDPGPVRPEPLAFFGVFDGHGGAEVAQHAASKLHHHFQASYKQLASAAALAGTASGSACSDSSEPLEVLLSESWPSNDSEHAEVSDPLDALLSPLGPEALSAAPPCSTTSGSSSSTTHFWSSPGAAAAAGRSSCFRHHQRHQHASRHSQRVVRALREAFIRTDAELEGTEVGELVGTTAVVAVVGQEEIFIGHCGDSRAVLCRKGVAVPLTSDHKPGRSDELARVSSLGGKVVYKGGSHRVMGLLAMSRALGDHFLRPYIIAEPEVMCIQRCPDDELLIIATDGLWDVFSCQEATTLALRSTIRARHRGASPAAACRVGASVLVRGAIERGSRDNITVVVIDLKRNEENISSVASVLASQCSDVPCLSAQTSRKRRSSSGSDGQAEAEGQPHNDSSGPSNSSTPSSSSGAAASAGRAPVAQASNRRHTSSNCDGNSSSRGTTCWGLQGPQPLPQHHEQRTSGIQALARAAAAAVAAFSGGSRTGRSRSQPGSDPAAVAASAPVPSTSRGGLISMQSAPVLKISEALAAATNDAASSAAAAGHSKSGSSQALPQRQNRFFVSVSPAPAAVVAGNQTGSSSSSKAGADKPPLPRARC